MAPLLRNALPEDALRHARPQIQDLSTENIANLAVRARELGDVIALWYGEGDMVTPAFIRDAAKAAFDEGLTFYIPEHARPPAAERGAVGVPDPAPRPAHSDRAHHRHAGRHAGALRGAGAARRYRHQCRLCRAAMAQHPQRDPPDRRRAAALCARFRRRLAARSRQAVRDLRCPHPRHLPVDPVQPDRLDGNARRDSRPCSISAGAPASGSSRTRSTAGSISTVVVAPSILQVAEDGDRVLSVNSFSKSLGDDRLARRLADAPVRRGRPDRRDDPVCQQRHVWPDPGRRGGGHPQGRAAGRGDQAAHQDRPRPRL